MAKTGVVILCHGSRGLRGVIEVPETLKRVTEGVRHLLPSGVEVIGAALQFNRPTLPEAVKTLLVRGAERIIIIPYFLFSGRHITEEIPRIIEEFEGAYPEKQFILADPLGLEEHFISRTVKRIEEAEPALWSNTSLSPGSPRGIEQESMEIVEGLLPPAPNMTAAEREVTRRVVHACGDPQVASLIEFSPSAISSGLIALDKGCHIFTDVRMVATGINDRLVELCRCSLSCALDEAGGWEAAEGQNITRAAAAMRALGHRLDGSIVAIGNAPTALLALLDLVDHQGVRPALVVGMPVGFVQAKESKDELVKRDVPYITVAGTRGGSAMAVAAINALLKIAAERARKAGEPQKKKG